MKSLDDKLAAIGIDPAGDPAAVFAGLHAAIGEEATVLDRYELEARYRAVAATDLDADTRRQLTVEVLAVRGYQLTGNTRGGEPMEIVPYDPVWPATFAEWRDRLAAALGGAAVAIEHIGSTAVPGLAAKATIDILVEVSDVDDEERYVRQIGSLGVPLRSRDRAHRYFRPVAPNPRAVHVHVAGVGSDWSDEHLLFRDYLRAHPDVVEEYGGLKRRLAEEYPTERVIYTDLKGGFIRETLEAAQKWRAALAREEDGG